MSSADVPGLDCLTQGHIWIQTETTDGRACNWCLWCGAGVSDGEIEREDPVAKITGVRTKSADGSFTTEGGET